MVLEATMIVIDNSEYMRNGDYTPSRFSSQSDAVNVIFGRKTNANPENTVGLMTSGGKTPQVLVTPTTDLGKILQGLHATQVSGEADIVTSLQVAQLALKHRQNKNQRQRIIAFVGSPIKPKADEKALVKLAKKLKKNNVAVDIVTFGSEEEIDDNEAPLKAFVDAVQSGENSHLVNVPPGANLLSDAIVSSAILAVDGGFSGDFGGGEPSGASGAQGSFEFGVDPSLDPELAMALRMSLEEEQARVAAQTTQNPAATGAASTTLTSIPENTAAGGAAAATAAPNLMDQDDEDEELARALLMSQQEQGGGSKTDDEDVDMDAADDEDDEGDEDDGEEEEDEEDAIAKAIAMSMADQAAEDKKKQQPPKK